jgi:hypothetical protein
VEYRYIDYFLRGGFISHRVDFLMPRNSFYDSLVAGIQVFKFGDWAASNHNPIILYSCLSLLLYVAILSIIKISTKFYSNKYSKLIKSINFSYFYILLLLVIFCLLISLFCGFYFWDGLISLRANFSFLNSINLTRFSLFLPCFWFLIFAYTLILIYNNFKYCKWVFIPFLLIAQATIELRNHEFLVSKGRYAAKIYTAVLAGTLINAVGTP